MIGDQRDAEAPEFKGIRPLGLVGEHCRGAEALAQAGVEPRQERMQT